MGTAIVLLIILAVVGAAIGGRIRDWKKGRSSCCGGCAGCIRNGSCSSKSPIA